MQKQTEGLLPQPIISGAYVQPSAVGRGQLLQKIDNLSFEIEHLWKSTPRKPQFQMRTVYLKF